ncbi:RNA polymerase subunit sigma-70 [Sulfitobacter mediterraneus]|uniref:RNA polymerase sigma factor n=1 Tax=Sulfitobacter mediterraneus TaxID=83219 RepID=UPI00193A725A|nr:DUF6596 domain-containing protein [Sulfitobacter mediterraneus]MBM1557991.1 RNA polymerase subunit sigma-70 [Sulfitobacter mediterraneus]MBM1569581.1 RNA polymerase subunit sigma-70 [Sulfitobacter mediterraneus]MBM1573196.1 RNA polymerase subunit sigma-70 [Sulfitobacter mediterraneus]MBM1577188.1 RNA polymerase subunit sigma-70 [Sulfitobacter mediterraneus]MBM1580981.1 RNA polymerase subunit sigma-70 [Sulfitobacter mediterraneus]
MTQAARAAEMAARTSYGRLLAFLSARTHDIALAEDALSAAFARALTHWPAKGVPDNPDAWLLSVARNHLTDHQRRQTRFPTQSEIPDMPDTDADDSTFPDERLTLLMVCAHPAIAADLHTPLMLQTVLGIDAKTIARLFMVSPAALAKRLVRAKAKIRDAGIPFQIPDADQLPLRSTAIAEAIYAVHAHDWLDPSDGMGEEALYLADLLAQLLPDDPEIKGLAALIALSHARAQARVQNRSLVPTPQQDVTLWDDRLIAYGNRQLTLAHSLGQWGRFQIEAAIEAVHMTRKDSGQTDWTALNKLYHALLQLAPTAGAMVAQAVVTARLHGAQEGLEALDRVEAQTGSGFQPLWAARADFALELADLKLANCCFNKAISLTTDLAVLRFLRQKRDNLPADP